ncbi:energy transducer TonB [Vibrio sp. S9_S30]|uniref:energy transducer TonB n=1 Tax=Vibrio sp. S9_S30 TaxID=2720226 RepID=UPI00168106A9|nr:energy transducer TonB [Vibrio sp. S9_S30]MBD1555736.1 energy transducer TonB [Vibrio sp. S9_S30]
MRRLLLALPLAFVIASSLFYFMAWMVGSQKGKIEESKSAVMFDLVMQEPESNVQRRQRQLPDPPKLPDQPKPLPTSTPNVTPAQMPQVLSAPKLALANLGVAISMPSLDGFGQDRQALPLYRVEPRYPPRAQKRRMEGYVILSFTIDEQGRPEDINLVEVYPNKIFAREAMNALKRWKYQPKLEDGKAVKQLNQKVKIEFKMSK